MTLAVFTELGTWVGLRRANLPSPPRHLQLRRNTYICAEEDMCRHQKSLTCVRKHYNPPPLHLLRAMRAVETPHHGSLKHVMSRVTSNLVSHAKSYLSSSLLVGESFSER